MKLVRGTFRGDRARQVVVSRLEGEVRQPPPWLTASARHLWAIKVRRTPDAARSSRAASRCSRSFARLGASSCGATGRASSAGGAAHGTDWFPRRRREVARCRRTRYGLDMSEADRAALIAFLRTL